MEAGEERRAHELLKTKQFTRVLVMWQYSDGSSKVEIVGPHLAQRHEIRESRCR